MVLPLVDRARASTRSGRTGVRHHRVPRDVPWQREPYATLNDATGFHIGETRWLRDRRYAADYIDYMYEGGNDRHFPDYLADAVYRRFLVDGDRAAAVRHLAVMRHLYRVWDDRFDFAKGCTGSSRCSTPRNTRSPRSTRPAAPTVFAAATVFRPSINAYQFANARAVSRIATLAGDGTTAVAFAARAAALKNRVKAALWQPGLAHFVDRYEVTNDHVRYWDPIRGRELAGYVPWTFGLPGDDPRCAKAWRHLVSPAEFAGRAGLRTVEPGYPYYLRQYRYEGTACRIPAIASR